MRKALFVALFFVFGASLANAQDIQRGEFGGGYSANWVDSQGAFSTDPNANGRDLFHGFYVNGGYDFSRYLGVQAEVSHNRKTTDFTSTTGLASRLEGRLTQGEVGIKVQDNSTDAAVRPFARALIGVGHASGNFTVGTVNGSETDNGFAGIFGGGLGIRIAKHADFVASADWNPIRLTDNSTLGTGSNWTHNFRAGLGINFRFGGSK
jgi:hypothetical protein